MKKFIYAFTGIFLLFTLYVAIASHAQENQAEAQDITLKAKDFSTLLGMPDFSASLLNTHFKLYQGYVNNTNLMLNALKTMIKKSQENTPEYAGLKRRLGWEYNGMLLHEYYFENLGGKDSLDSNNNLYKKMIEDFGSYENWKRDFIATGLMRGIGWVVLYYEPRANRLVNAWINEHDTGHLANAKPLLVIDVFEHAYMADYSTDKAKYIDAFFRNINWKVVQERFK